MPCQHGGKFLLEDFQHMDNLDNRSDPIRKKYFSRLENVNKISEILFYMSAIMSFIFIFLDRYSWPITYSVLQISFVIMIMAFTLIGIFIRLYFTPLANDKSLKDFLSHAYGESLTHEKTSGYYNNDMSSGNKKMAAQLLENSFFSKEIISKMLVYIRIKTCIYAILWLICILYRKTDLDFIIIASQVLFGEQIILKWINAEWIRIRFNFTYDKLYSLFRTNENFFNVSVLESLITYETSKSAASITLSSKVFEKLNSSLSEEWSNIKSSLNIK